MIHRSPHNRRSCTAAIGRQLHFADRPVSRRSTRGPLPVKVGFLARPGAHAAGREQSFRPPAWMAVQDWFRPFNFLGRMSAAAQTGRSGFAGAEDRSTPKRDVRYPVVRAAGAVHRLHFEVGTNNGVLARQIPTMPGPTSTTTGGRHPLLPRQLTTHHVDHRNPTGHSRQQPHQHWTIHLWQRTPERAAMGRRCFVDDRELLLHLVGHPCVSGRQSPDRLEHDLPLGPHLRAGTGRRRHPRPPATRGDVNIGNDVWIAHGVTIMSASRWAMVPCSAPTPPWSRTWRPTRSSWSVVKMFRLR